MNGQEAEIFIGAQRFIKVNFLQYGQQQERIQSVPVGVRLVVTPWTGGNREITTKLYAEVSNIVEIDASTGLPLLSTRSANSTVRAKDGETIFMTKPNVGREGPNQFRCIGCHVNPIGSGSFGFTGLINQPTKVVQLRGLHERSGRKPTPRGRTAGFGYGAAFKWWPVRSSSFYVVGTVNDLNGDPEELSLDTVFDESQFFYGLELGYFWKRGPTDFDHLHLDVFYADERDSTPAPLPNESGGGFKLLGEKQWEDVVGFASYTYNQAEGAATGSPSASTR